jgi:hypothetical protein
MSFTQITNGPTAEGYLAFLRESVGIGPEYLADDSLWVQATYAMAIATVNNALIYADYGNSIYAMAVYNYGADRLLNLANDAPGQCFFRDQRQSLGLHSFSAGLVVSSADQGTSQSLEIINAAKSMTLTDLQMMKTPYGRAYLDYAQNYGGNIWGLTTGRRVF